LGDYRKREAGGTSVQEVWEKGKVRGIVLGGLRGGGRGRMTLGEKGGKESGSKILVPSPIEELSNGRGGKEP